MELSTPYSLHILQGDNLVGGTISLVYIFCVEINTFFVATLNVILILTQIPIFINLEKKFEHAMVLFWLGLGSAKYSYLNNLSVNCKTADKITI